MSLSSIILLIISLIGFVVSIFFIMEAIDPRLRETSIFPWRK